MTSALRKPMDARKRLIAAVHAEAKRAGIDDDTYRALLERVTGQKSSKDLSANQLGAVLDAIKNPASTSKSVRHRQRRARAEAPHANKIRALWLSLWQLGEVRSADDNAISAFAKRQLGVDALEWVHEEHAASIIEALKACAAASVTSRSACPKPRMNGQAKDCSKPS